MIGIRWALAVTTAERYLTLAIVFAMTIAVSRLLTPAEIGVWAIGLATATTFLAFREFTTGVFLISTDGPVARGDPGRVHDHAADERVDRGSHRAVGAVDRQLLWRGQAHVLSEGRGSSHYVRGRRCSADGPDASGHGVHDLAIVNTANIAAFASVTVALAALVG